MDYGELKKSITSIEMPNETLERIIKNCRSEAVRLGCSFEKNENRDGVVIAMKKTARKPIKIAVVAAVVCLITATAVAVSTQLFHNPSIVDSPDGIFDVQTGNTDSPSAVGVFEPASGIPSTLEEVTESLTFKSHGWLSEDTMGGSVTAGYDWVSMEIVAEDGSPKSRYVYADNGAVKTEYVAENPLDLKSVESGYIGIDLAWMNENYNYIPNANYFYIIEDKKGEYVGENFSALYANEDESAWFTLGYTRRNASRNGNVNNYIAQGDYDEVYLYMTADGYEFVIKTYGDCIWADSTTKHSSIRLTGGYMSTNEVEEILDNLSLYVVETVS